MNDIAKHSLPGTDLAGYLVDYPREIVFGPEDAGTVFDRYHTSDFLLYNDGIALDRGRLLAHVRPARKNATTVHTEVHQVVASGGRVAAYYTLEALMRTGRAVTTEICMFGELAADGRLRRVHQITRSVPATTPAPAAQGG
jgi:hypothetical protein